MRQPLSQRARKRKIQYFEDREAAGVRAKRRKEMEKAGMRKKKRHSPQPDQVQFDKVGLLTEVQSMKDGDKVSGPHIFH